MRKRLYVAMLSLIIILSAFVQTAGDRIVGVWWSEKKDGKVQIYKAGSTYEGKVIWGTELMEADGKTPAKDKNNPDPKLRNRNLKDLVILSGFTYSGDEWTGGKIYDPHNGKSYSCTLKLKGNELEVHGYVGISLIGRTTVWTRVQ